jgi:hypothetical protein
MIARCASDSIVTGEMLIVRDDIESTTSTRIRPARRVTKGQLRTTYDGPFIFPHQTSLVY